MELHASVKQVKRSDGRSSVAAAAYRSATRMTDDRTGVIHDYTKKQGVEHTQLYAPDHAPDWAHDRATLWDACEHKENRRNSCTAHELEIGFPVEFNATQRREAGEKIALELLNRYGSAVEIAYHHPSKNGDDRNFHAHIMFTTRGFDPSSKDGWAKTKFRDLSADKMRVDGENTTRGKQEVLQLREFTANTMNRIAKRERLDVFVNHLSFQKRGIDREPQQHMGREANAMQNNGKKSRIGDNNRQAIERNIKRAENRAMLALVSAELNQERRTLERQHKNRTAKVVNAGKQQQQSIEQRHALEQRQLRQTLRERNAVAKATISQEIQAVSSRLKSTSGLKKALRFVFGATRNDQQTHATLANAYKAISTIETREIRRLDKTHKLERQKAQQRVEKVKTRVSQTTKKRKQQLQTRHDRKKREVEKQLFKDRAKPPTPQPAPQAKAVNDLETSFTRSADAKAKKPDGWNRSIKSVWGRKTENTNDNERKTDGWNRHRSKPNRDRKPE